MIGHANGVITIDLAESEASHREQVREKLGEPYRTMLGHFRHDFLLTFKIQTQGPSPFA